MTDSHYTRMLEEGIDTHFNISIGTIWGIDIFDLCTIFANALDNALEASQKVMDKGRRKVELSVKDEKGIFSFHLMNYKENSIIEKGGMLLSDKENEKEHGFGVGNIRSIVDKYGGKMEIVYEDKKFVLFLYMRS